MITENNRSNESGAGSRLNGLSTDQLIRLVIIGVVFWFGGAVAVRMGEPVGFLGPQASLIAFALALPVGWGGVLIAIAVARLRPDQILPGIAIGTAAATFCDGLAFTWASGLYGKESEYLVFGAAWILWGAFAFFAAAIVEALRRSPKN